MTVQNQTITAGEYTGNDVASRFNYTWRVTHKDQVIVIQTDDEGVETVLTVDTDYRVNGIGDDGGGEIVLLVDTAETALPTDYTLFMRSNFVPTQLTNFESQGAFYPENHEDAFDKLTRLIQQLIWNDDLTLQFNANTTLNNFNPALPAPNLPLGYLRINADGTALEWVENSSGLDLSQAFNFTNELTVNGNDVYTIENIAEAALPPIAEVGTAIQLLATHQSKGMVCTAATPVVVTVEDFATEPLPVGSVVPVYQAGVGQVSFLAGANVTIEYKATEGLSISEQFGFATLWQRATNIWVLSGSIAP